MDTHEISMLYRSRPVSQIDVSFGQWFCSAIHQYDPRLRGATSADSAKELILSSKYNELPELKSKLIAYNIQLCQQML